MPVLNMWVMSTRELLIIKATELFAKKGYDGTTVKDIADAADANISLVSYYFGGKEALFQECLKDFGKERMVMADKILQVPRSQQEFNIRFEMFIDEGIRLYSEQTHLLTLIHNEFESKGPKAIETFKSTFLKIVDMIITFFDAAQKQGFIKKDVSPAMTAFLLMGSFRNIFLHPDLKKVMLGFTVDNEEGKKKVKEHFMKIFLHGICNDTKR